MVGMKKFAMCRYYGEGVSVFVDGVRENSNLYLILQVVDTVNKSSSFQTMIFPKETFKTICKGHNIDWFIEEYNGLNGITKLINCCRDNNLLYRIIKEKVV